MKRPFSVIVLMAGLLAAPTSFGSNQWRLDELGVGLQFPEHWHLSPQSVSGDLAKGGLLLRALRTPGIPAGVRFELQLEPLAIQNPPLREALKTLVDGLKQTPQVLVRNNKTDIVSASSHQAELTWQIEGSNHTIVSLYRVLDRSDRRFLISISGRQELIQGVRTEINQVLDSMGAE